MEAVDTINDVFGYNLKQFRGDATQAQISEQADIPLRTYQRMEAGAIPKVRRYLTNLAKIYRIPETRFFLDPDLISRASRPTPAEALAVIQEAISRLNQ